MHCTPFQDIFYRGQSARASEAAFQKHTTLPFFGFLSKEEKNRQLT